MSGQSNASVRERAEFIRSFLRSRADATDPDDSADRPRG